MAAVELLAWSGCRSAEDVYLFHAVAHENPKDERLIALAEVRDLTAVRDSAGRIIGLPASGGDAGAGARRHPPRAQAARPPRAAAASNRVVLYVRPGMGHPTGTWRSLAHRLAPLAAAWAWRRCGPDPASADAGDGRDARCGPRCREHRGQGRDGAGQPPVGPSRIRPLTEYKQKVLRARRLGLPYPYELIRMLTPPPGAPADFPAGEFVEYDLDDGDGAGCVPVDRAVRPQPRARDRGRRDHQLHRPLVPEGMRRVAILGDPTAGLGNLAEPECRRILAALDLADRLQVPVEWFALSSGARIAMDSGTENMDWIAAVLRRLSSSPRRGGEVNVVVTGINVGAQPYWNAEATMLMHTRGILVMTPASAMVLTGKSSLDYSGGVSAEDNLGIGGFERIMGPNGQAQYWAPDTGWRLRICCSATTSTPTSSRASASRAGRRPATRSTVTCARSPAQARRRARTSHRSATSSRPS